MPTKPTTALISVGSQAANRYVDTFFDQHKSARFPDGRPWWGFREFAANKGEPDGFVSADLMPGEHGNVDSVWTAPFYPEARFFEFNYLRHRITIRYDKMLAHDRHYYEAYYEAADLISHEKGWPETPYGSTPRHAIVSVIGRPPRSPKIAQAAMAGDRWLLGATDEVNEELAVMMGLSRRGLKLERGDEEPVTKPADIVTMTKEELAAFVAEQVAAAMQKQPKRKRGRPVASTNVSASAGDAA